MNRSKSKLICLLIILALSCNGCVTPKLWKATDPNESIRMEYATVNEEDLKSKGLKYVKDDLTQSYSVEKDSSQKFQDYTYRVLGTPLTVALDATFGLAFSFAYSMGENFIEEAKERGREAEVTRNGYRTESFPLPRNPYPR